MTGWGVPVTVFKKFGEDRAGRLVALVAYCGFFSLFPLMLAAVILVGIFVGVAPRSRIASWMRRWPSSQ